MNNRKSWWTKGKIIVELAVKSHVISIDVISYKNKFDHHYIILLKKG